MLWLMGSTLASSSFAVPAVEPVTVVSTRRQGVRPTLLNPGDSRPGKRWTLRELTARGRFPVETCTNAMRGPYLAYRTCSRHWTTPPPEVELVVPWWIFWR